jgi:hypothetical protein
VSRNHRNACKAYETVLEFLSKLTLIPSERQAVESKPIVSKARLEAG